MFYPSSPTYTPAPQKTHHRELFFEVNVWMNVKGIEFLYGK